MGTVRPGAGLLDAGVLSWRRSPDLQREQHQQVPGTAGACGWGRRRNWGQVLTCWLEGGAVFTELGAYLKGESAVLCPFFLSQRSPGEKSGGSCGFRSVPHAEVISGDAYLSDTNTQVLKASNSASFSRERQRRERMVTRTLPAIHPEH